MKPRVLLDIDGVIANFYYEFAKYLNSYYACTLDLFNDPEQYDFDTWGNGVENIDIGRASNEWLESGGLSDVPAYIGAADFVNTLEKLCEVFIVTARIGDWAKPLSDTANLKVRNDTYEWLKKHNMPCDNLHFTHKKIDFCLNNSIYLIIEDKLSTALEAAKNNIDTILINRNYNYSPIDRFRVYRASNFDDIINRVKHFK